MGVSAWLITWEWIGDHAKPQGNRIVEILSPRFSAERVREIIDLRYHCDASFSEKIAWRLRKQEQPYPAQLVRLHGVEWAGQITCGHNPWLLGRLVDNLLVTIVDGHEEASWVDRNPVSQARKKIARKLETDAK